MLKTVFTFAAILVVALFSSRVVFAQSDSHASGIYDPPSASTNYSLALNGAGAYVTVLSSESLNIIGPVTVEAWIKTNSNTTQQGIIERYNWLGTAADGGYGIRLTSNGKAQFFTVQVAGVADSIEGGTLITTGV